MISVDRQFLLNDATMNDIISSLKFTQWTLSQDSLMDDVKSQPERTRNTGMDSHLRLLRTIITLWTGMSL